MASVDEAIFIAAEDLNLSEEWFRQSQRRLAPTL
jgi:hypothetical protein